MTTHSRKQQIRLLLLASAVGAMMIPSAIRAEDDIHAGELPPVYNSLPEIEIDGSVLQQLGNKPSATAAGQPVQLAPPEIAAQTLTAPTLTDPEYSSPSSFPAKPGVPTLTAIIGETGSAAATRQQQVKPVIREIPVAMKSPVITTKEIIAEPLPAVKTTASRPVIREIPAPGIKAVPAARMSAKPMEKPVRIIAKAPDPLPEPQAPPVPQRKPLAPAPVIANVIQKPEPLEPQIIKNESEMKISAQTVHSLIEEIASTPLANAAAEEISPPDRAVTAKETAVIESAAEVKGASKEIMPPMPGKDIIASKAFENIKPPEPGSIAVFPVKMLVRDTTPHLPAQTARHAPVAAEKMPAPPVVEAAPVKVQPVVTEILASATPAVAPVPAQVVKQIAEEKIPEKIKVWNTSVAVEPVILGPAPVFTLPEIKEPEKKQEIVASVIPAPPVPKTKPVAKAKEEAPVVVEDAHDDIPPAPETIASIIPPVKEEKPAEDLHQEKPDVIIKAEVPVPGRRPEKQMASQEFVQQARRTVMETYTVMRNDGVPMPAVAREDVTQENLPPVRMSIDDLANDPLAAKILDMTPEEVAATLNKVTPAAGRQLSRELNAVSKPRIIRQEGERIFKSRRNLEPVADLAEQGETLTAQDTTPVKEPVATKPVETASKPPEPEVIKGERLDLALPFAAGAVDLAEDAKIHMDNGVIPVLKSRDGMRIQIVAFASPTEGKEATARRTALSRALAVRSYLISQGIDATRMDVRALGIQTDPQAEKDKVDIHLVMPEKS